MKKAMGGSAKRVVIVLAILVGGLTLVLGGVELALRLRLASIINNRLAPAVADTSGCSLTIGSARASLLGSLSARDVQLTGPAPVPGSPPLLSLGTVKLAVTMRELLDRVVDIDAVSADALAVALVRTPEGELNLAQVRAAAQGTAPQPQLPPPAAPPETPSTSPQAPRAATASKTTPAVGVRIHTLDAQGRVIYQDYYHRDQPLELALELVISGQSLSTVQGDREPGFISMRGHLADSPDVFKTDLVVKLDPLTDPANPSFTASGKIVDIDMTKLGDWPDHLGVTSKSVSLSIELVCKDGVFVPGRSLITARMRNARLAGELADKHENVKLPPELSLKLPVDGPLDAPHCNLVQALIGTVLGNGAENVDYILDNTTIDGKTLRERSAEWDKKLGKELGKLFK